MNLNTQHRFSGIKSKANLRHSSLVVKEHLHNKMFLIPSFITVIGIFCGFLAILAVLKGEYDYAVRAIFLAIILDGLDGRVARKLNATSAFGREFDSLSDIVSFGIAPAFLVYHWAFFNGADDFGTLVVFVYVVCGATRLARFNITTGSEPKKHFDGLPIPAAAATVAALPYIIPDFPNTSWMIGFITVYVVTVAGLMVSTFPYKSIKHLKLTGPNPRVTLFLIAAAVALCWYHSRIFLLTGSLIYSASGPLLYFFEKRRKIAPPSTVS